MLAALRDWFHERRIDIACWLMIWHHEGRQKSQARFLRLIRARSKARVERMERDRGIA